MLMYSIVSYEDHSKFHLPFLNVDIFYKIKVLAMLVLLFFSNLAQFHSFKRNLIIQLITELNKH